MASTAIQTVRLMLVSTEPSLVRLLGTAAQSNGWHLQTSRSAWDAMERVHSADGFKLVMLDVQSADGRDLHLLLWLKRLYPELPIAVVCDAADRNSQREAKRMGAQAILFRPVRMEQLESLVRRSLRQANENTEVDVASEDIEVLGEDEFFLSVSPVMQKVRIQAELLAQTELPVLILGEPGSGKGTVARLIHKLSVHGGFRFLRVNCSDMPADLLDIELFGAQKGAAVGATGLAGGKTGAGKLEIGKNGTILLDEITAMPLALQIKLLQVLQDRRAAHSGEGRQLEVGLRILAASSDKVDRALAEKRLHEGLYHALSAFTVHVPPLRQRRDEINSLLRYSMHTVARHYGLTPREFAQSTIEACLNHSWPGNLEELQNFVKRYLVAGDSELPVSDYESDSAFRGYGNVDLMRVRPHSPQAVAPNSGGTAQKTLKSLIHVIKCETERTAIAAALDKTGWNRKAAARLLGVSYRTMLYKIDQYQMTSAESFVSPFADASLAGPDHSKGRG